MTKRLVATLFLVMAYSTASFGAPTIVYYVSHVEVADLGTLGGDESTALDINKSGQIVGWADNGAGLRRPFLYEGGARCRT